MKPPQRSSLRPLTTARMDSRTVNAFEKDGEWLAGENVQLLYPQQF
jgi:hypothetical protein